MTNEELRNRVAAQVRESLVDLATSALAGDDGSRKAFFDAGVAKLSDNELAAIAYVAAFAL